MLSKDRYYRDNNYDIDKTFNNTIDENRKRGNIISINSNSRFVDLTLI